MRFTHGAAIALLWTAPLWVHALPAATAQGAANRAAAELKTGQPVRAADALLDLKTLQGADAVSRRLYVETSRDTLHALQRQFLGDPARSLATHLYRIAPSEPVALVFMAGVQVAGNQADDALVLLGDAAKAVQPLVPLTPRESALASSIRGEALFLKKNYSGAEAAYRQALKTDPANGRHQFGFAYVLFSEGKESDAEQAYADGFSRVPDFALPSDYLCLASLYQKRKNHLACATLLEKAVAAFPAEPNLNLNLGKAYLAQDRPADALFSFYEELLRLPAGEEAEASPGMKKVQQHIAAASKKAATLKGGPQRGQVEAFLKGINQLGTNDGPGAITSFGKCITLNPRNSSTARFYQAQAIAMAGKEAEAAKILDELITAQPRNPALLASRADLAFILGRNKEGIFFLGQAVGIGADNWRVRQSVSRFQKILDQIDPKDVPANLKGR